jgi:hypothetical protein
VGHVGLTDGSERVFAVERLVGQAEAALGQVGGVVVGPAGVGEHRQPERAGHALAAEPPHEVQQAGGGVHRVDGIEVGPDRVQVQRLDALLVHEAGVEVTDLLGLRTGLVGGGRQRLQQGVDVAFGLVSQAVERSVAGPVVGDRRLQEPAAVHGPEQVVLRTDGRILVVTVDPGGGHLHCAPCVGR